MKRTFLTLFTIAALFGEDPKPLPKPKDPSAPPVVSESTRLAFAEADASVLSAQAAYDALPAQIKKAFEDTLQSLQTAAQARQAALAQAQADCGTAHQPALDGKKLVCQVKPVLASPPSKQ